MNLHVCIEIVCIQGDNLLSVSANEIHVTIGGAPCVIAAIDTNDGMVSTYIAFHVVVIAILQLFAQTYYGISVHTHTPIIIL